MKKSLIINIILILNFSHISHCMESDSIEKSIENETVAAESCDELYFKKKIDKIIRNNPYHRATQKFWILVLNLVNKREDKLFFLNSENILSKKLPLKL